MARTVATLPAGSRITDYISLGVVARCFPREKIDEVLQQTERTSVRERDLPAHVVVYYVIALALYMRSSYREVLRCLLEGVQWLLDPSAKVKVAGKSGISQARTRLGAAEPEATIRCSGASDCGEAHEGSMVPAMASGRSLDGSTLDVADTAENEKAFGRPGASRGSSAFPKIRFVALLENGTHVLWAARMAPYATDELTLGRECDSGAAQRNAVPRRPVLSGLQTLADGGENGSRSALARARERTSGRGAASARRLPISAASMLRLQIGGMGGTGSRSGSSITGWKVWQAPSRRTG